MIKIRIIKRVKDVDEENDCAKEVLKRLIQTKCPDVPSIKPTIEEIQAWGPVQSSALKADDFKVLKEYFQFEGEGTGKNGGWLKKDVVERLTQRGGLQIHSRRIFIFLLQCTNKSDIK